MLVVDDLIATGGTAIAGIKLLERAGAKVVGCSFVIDLPELGGADTHPRPGQDRCMRWSRSRAIEVETLLQPGFALFPQGAGDRP